MPPELVSEILRISGNPSAIRLTCKPFGDRHHSSVTEFEVEVDVAACMYPRAQLRKMSWTRTCECECAHSIAEPTLVCPGQFDVDFPGPSHLASMASLDGLTSLTSLCLDCIDVDFGLHAPRLKSLTLTSCRCRCLPDIRKLTTLTFLDISDTKGADMSEVLPGIGTLSHLEHLSLSQSVDKYPSDAFVPLAGLTRLTHLALSKHSPDKHYFVGAAQRNSAPLSGLVRLTHWKVDALYRYASQCTVPVYAHAYHVGSSTAWIAALTALTSIDMSHCIVERWDAEDPDRAPVVVELTCAGVVLTVVKKIVHRYIFRDWRNDE